MNNIRNILIILILLLALVISAEAQVYIGIGLPNVRIGISLPLYPQLVLMPGYPVYYAPQVAANYFFYDGMYWVYMNDNWYASSWYNGPWGVVGPDSVPLYILRIPVSYYRQPPAYFRGWQSNAPPHWGQHWGQEWEQRHNGWEKWKRGSGPAPAPLPVYQRQYSGDKYPQFENQQKIRSRQYRYQPHEKIVRQHFKSHVEQNANASAAVSHHGNENIHSPTPVKPRAQQRVQKVHDQNQKPNSVQHELQSSRLQGGEIKSQNRGASQETNRSNGQGQNKEEHGRVR